MYYQFSNDESVNVSSNTYSFSRHNTCDIEGIDHQNITDSSTEDFTNAAALTSTKKRKSLTAAQCGALEKEFAKRTYIDRLRRDDLAVELNLSSIQVRVWFRNRRTKELKKLKVGQRKPSLLKMVKNSTSTFQPKSECPLTATHQSAEVDVSSNGPMCENLSYLMSEMNVNDRMNDCGNLDHDFACCTKVNFQPLKTNPYIGPLTHHYDVPAPYISSSFDYEYDFFNDYSYY